MKRWPSLTDHDPKRCTWDTQVTASRNCTCGALAVQWEIDEQLRKNAEKTKGKVKVNAKESY